MFELQLNLPFFLWHFTAIFLPPLEHSALQWIIFLLLTWQSEKETPSTGLHPWHRSWFLFGFKAAPLARLTQSIRAALPPLTFEKDGADIICPGLHLKIQALSVWAPALDGESGCRIVLSALSSARLKVCPLIPHSISYRGLPSACLRNWLLSLLNSPTTLGQVSPTSGCRHLTAGGFPVNPASQEHLNPPWLFVQTLDGPQLWAPDSHSLMSEQPVPSLVPSPS